MIIDYDTDWSMDCSTQSDGITSGGPYCSYNNVTITKIYPAIYEYVSPSNNYTIIAISVIDDNNRKCLLGVPRDGQHMYQSIYYASHIHNDKVIKFDTLKENNGNLQTDTQVDSNIIGTSIRLNKCADKK